MAEPHTLPGIGLTGGYDLGAHGWRNSMNFNLLATSALAQLTVESMTTALPGSPVDGKIYINPTIGADQWKIAVRDDGAWTMLAPMVGWRAWVVDEANEVVWNGTAWRTLPAPFDIQAMVAGSPAASGIVLRHVFVRAANFADDFSGSQASADTAATASTVFVVKKNGSNIGTISFSSAGTTGVFATSGSTIETFVPGDVLSVIAPSSPDATLANISLNFAGSR